MTYKKLAKGYCILMPTEPELGITALYKLSISCKEGANHIIQQPQGRKHVTNNQIPSLN